MKLFTKKILKRLPGLDSTSEKEIKDIKVICKLFNAFGSQRWYLIEYDPKTQMSFCFANLGDDQFAELGYVSIKELIECKVPRFKLERDLYFDPTPLKQVMDFKVR